MADVGREIGARRDDGPAARSRGQLLLVTALSLAILFVSLALILNTAIYTENLATRSGDIGGATDAVRYHDAARDAIGGVIEYANAHNNTSHVTLESNLTAGVDAFRNNSARLLAGGDRAVETTLDTQENGTRIAQTDANRNFTNASGTATDWTVATGVDNTRAAVINVSTTDSLADSGTGDEFNLTLTSGGDTWRLNVTHDGASTTTIGVVNGDGDHVTCAAGSETPVIDITAGTIDGEPCDGLVLAEGLGGSYDIAIESGDHINGTFSMVVDDPSVAQNVGSNDNLVADGAGQPFAAHAIYSANVTVVYETSRLYYNTSVRVAPEEPDG